MCLVTIAHRAHPRFPLLVSANRDELHARPTAPARPWEGTPRVIAGRDLTAGGTWLGINDRGRFAALTNVRSPQDTTAYPNSRGHLVAGFLTGDGASAAPTAREYLLAISDEARHYAPFNLLVADIGELWFFSNAGAATPPRPLPPGVYGVSNASLDTPWPKLSLGKQNLQRYLEQLDRGGQSPSHDRLSRILSSRRVPPRTTNLMSDSAAGLPDDLARVLDAQFVCHPVYGTRCSTTLWRSEEAATGSSAFDFRERRFDAAGEACGADRWQLPVHLR